MYSTGGESNGGSIVSIIRVKRSVPYSSFPTRLFQDSCGKTPCATNALCLNITLGKEAVGKLAVRITGLCSEIQ